VQPEETAIARQWHTKHMSAATDTRIEWVEELLEAVFSVWSVPRLYNENLWANWFKQEIFVRW
jgi:hypothetical protein